MARSLDEIQRDINRQKKMCQEFEELENALVNLQNKLGVYGWNHFNSAFATIKEGYEDDDGKYIGYSLMDDIIGSGGKYDKELINKVNALRKKANYQKNYCYNKLCSLKNEYSVAYREYLENSRKNVK